MRIREFDILKGFAIFVVVFVHATFFSFGRYPTVSRNLLMIFTTFLAPAIAIFFFISGFLGYRSYMKRKSFHAFEVSKFKIILPPYLVWSTIYLILQVMFGEIVGYTYHFGLINVLEKYLLGEAFLPFYYIVLLMLFYILTPLFSNLDIKTLKTLLSILFVIGFFFMGLYFVPQYFGKMYVSSLMTYRNPFAWIFFYVWGMYMAKVGNISWRERPSWWVIVGFFVTYSLSALEMITVPKLTKDWESYLILGPGVYVFYFFAIKMFLWVSYTMSESMKIISKVLSALGKDSFGIYLSHGVILYGILGVALLFDKNFLNENSLSLNSLAGLIGITLCYGFSEILQKLPRPLSGALI